MECPRCQGLMVADECADYLDSADISIVAWRCVICGEVLDPVILKHRSAQPEPMIGRARARNIQGLAVPRYKTRQPELWGEPNGELNRVAFLGVEGNSADQADQPFSILSI